MHQEFEPPVTLKYAIKCFWYERRDFGRQGSGFEIMPDGYAEIIFLFGNDCYITSDGHLQPLGSPFIMGLLNQPAVLHTKGTLEVISIRCYPWAVFDLLGLPSGRESFYIIEHPVAGLQSVLNENISAGRITDAVDKVKQYFLDKGVKAVKNNILFKAGAAMNAVSGTIPVSQVAAAAHATVRTLERKFKQSSGYTVKDVSGLMRFEQARNQLWINPKFSLSVLAHELGYTDQAHFSRDFKRYSGATPASFARKAKNGKQALSSDLITIGNT